MGEWRCSSTHSYLRHQMVVSGKLHASATLVGLMESPVAIEHEYRFASETLWMVWRKVSLSVPGIEIRFFGHPAPGLVTVLNAIIRRLLRHFYLAIISGASKDTEGLPGQLRPTPGRRSHSFDAPQLGGQTKVCGNFIPSTKLLR